MHEFGPGKVTAAAVADAHKAGLATQGKHDVEEETTKYTEHTKV